MWIEELLKLIILLVLGIELSLLGSPEGKILTIDTVSQNRLNKIEINEIWRKFKEIGF